ncbi:MAG TPA: cupin domain-containing protein [Bryobacteraceae bacterium]|jgi:mannose-6-phosphate isomerase-like protein (cupin superfamily)|nr:cupin domain-containing protein [Bryobacteraceae bacterium]
MKLLTVLALFLATSMFAADPEGFAMYKASDIQARAKAARLDENKAGADRVATWGNHGLLIVRREGDGAAETHDKQVDMVTVVSGNGTLIVGGKMVDGKTTAPGEIRGKSIDGGIRRPMAPGDVFHIPAGIPHQMLVPKSLVIQVVKIETK